ncbi:bifunctional lysylphosphatidylglycerol flippase/synthetase MprF [Paenibacillus medicaginis]|uniref:Phosphatidylglycerol lysyltransferase n=1 Tax=Paenibacillus medicaginis TaxID=1470560 RepID=A0ABV5C424_9BACL
MLTALKQLKSFRIVQLILAAYQKRIVRLLIPLIILALVIWLGSRELHNMNIGRMLFELRRLTPWSILEIALFSLLAAGVMSSYDLVVRKHFRMPISIGAAFRYGWIANTFNNACGFAGFTGAGLRAFLYKKSGVPLNVITAAVIFLSPVVITGLSLLAWTVLARLFPADQLLHAYPWLRWAMWGMALYLPVFLLVQRSRLFGKWFNQGKGTMPWTTIFASLASSLLEWLFAALAFGLVGTRVLDGVPLEALIGVYVIAATAGLISMAPGGIGAFDVTALLGLQLLGVHPDLALTVLLLFRFFYFIVPWLIALVMTAVEIIPKRERIGELAGSGWSYSLNKWQQIWAWPGQFRFLADLGVWALSKLVLASGLLLLLSAALPGLLYRLRFAEKLLTLPIMQLSHDISVIIGIMLIVLSHGISLRIRRALRLTLGLLFAGAIFTFIKGFDFEEAFFLLFVALMLYLSRSRFYREGAPVSRTNLLIWGGLTVLVTVAYLLIGAGGYSYFLHRLPLRMSTNLLFDRQHFGIKGLLSLLSAWVFLTMYLMMRPKRGVEELPDAAEMDRLREFIAHEQGNLLTHMLFLGDKQFYWAQEGNVLIPYARSRNKLVVLGDPLGPMDQASAAIQEFQGYADRYALAVVFYQASPAYLPLYHENGYRFFKLGEEALVPLESFTLAGKINTPLRTVRNRFGREGYSFQMAYPPFDDSLLTRLRAVSDVWLEGRKEKGYSLGWFNETYLQLAPLALVLDPQQQVIAFASLAPAYDNKQTISIDLMRHLPDAPNGTMDFLFTHVMEWARDEGYVTFNLGMAPLSSVGQSERALREEKLARLVFQYGGHWYGFQGLRRYKEKFSPAWEPRYLAYPASVSLPILTAELMYLVSRKMD